MNDHFHFEMKIQHLQMLKSLHRILKCIITIFLYTKPLFPLLYELAIGIMIVALCELIDPCPLFPSNPQMY